MKLNFYLEHKRFNGDDTFLFIHQILEAGKWLSMPDEVIQELEVLDTKEDSESAYLLLDIRRKALNHLKSWKNIHTLEDINEFKLILQRAYLENYFIDDAKKIQILSALSSYYLTSEDEKFFQNVLNNVFTIKNIYFSNQIPRKCYDAIIYIKNINEKKCNGLKYIRDKDGEITKIFYIGNNLYSNLHTQISALKALDFFQISKMNFLNDYIISNPFFCSFSGKETENTIFVKVNDNNLYLKASLNNKIIFEIENLDLAYLMRQIYSFMYEYRKREQKKFDKGFKHKDFSIVIYSNKTIEFILIWVRNKSDYATVIKCGDVKTIKLDTVETINLFQQIFLHQTFYHSTKYNICLKSKTEFFNKEFLKVIGLKL